MPRAILGHPIDEAPLTIAALAEHLGVSPSTLRTWDRRYGLGPSLRTAGSHRRYTPVDVARIEQMRALMAEGVSTSDAARQVIEADEESLQIDCATTVSAQALIGACREGNIRVIRSILDHSVAHSGLMRTWSEIIAPARAVLEGDRVGDRPGHCPRAILTGRVMKMVGAIAAQSPFALAQGEGAAPAAAASDSSASPDANGTGAAKNAAPADAAAAASDRAKTPLATDSTLPGSGQGRGGEAAGRTGPGAWRELAHELGHGSGQIPKLAPVPGVVDPAAIYGMPILLVSDIDFLMQTHILAAALMWRGLDTRVLTMRPDLLIPAAREYVAEAEPRIVAIVGANVFHEQLVRELNEESGAEVVLIGADIPVVLAPHVQRLRTLSAAAEEIPVIAAQLKQADAERANARRAGGGEAAPKAD